ncbi:sugar transferase [Litoreibacter roseus]|uniref:Sugar transferase n=1 Tax=Litoreibacter roseus TaxID=2601869 RepID=A0A6N6JF70_9RHOB|nr:sugar transferase [Litoreibacter roseus]GFE64597.1 sugar transferase [Litoreibacter roseus]
MTAPIKITEVDGFGPVEPVPAARPFRKRIYDGFGKRALDLTLIALSLPLIVPLITLMALAVILQGQKPFFRQRRIGRHGDVFTMFKLQTMCRNADAKLGDILKDDPDAAAAWAKKQKLDHDPRVTPVGRVLRKSSMDELPQIWNVLIGDMSLVGPRPMMENQAALYEGTAYFNLRPGLTGPWQVSARNKSSFGQRAHFDDLYGRKKSLTYDVAMILRTLRVVARGTGS